MSSSGCPAAPISRPMTPFVDGGVPAHLGPARGRRRSRRRGLCEGRPGKSGVAFRHERAGGDEPDHADLRRDDGLGAGCVHHWPGAHRAARDRTVFKEADTLGITIPIVKHSFMIQDPREIPRAIHEAFYIARERPPRPGAGRHPAGFSRAARSSTSR